MMITPLFWSLTPRRTGDFIQEAVKDERVAAARACKRARTRRRERGDAFA